MPFAGYPDFAACVSDNQDKSDPEAFCAWLEHETTGSWPGEMTAGLPDSAQVSFWDAFARAKPTGESQAHKAAIAAVEKLGFVYKNRKWTKQAQFKMETRQVLGIPIFSVGTHNGDPYTKADLDSMVEAFNQLKGRVDPPLKIGHSSDEFNKMLADKMGVVPELISGENGNGAMAFGWISALRRDGDVLYADVSDVPAPLAELIESKAYNKVSAEVVFDLVDGEKVYKKVLTGLALLGAELPAVKVSGLATAAVYTVTKKPSAVVEFGDVTVEAQALANEMFGGDLEEAITWAYGIGELGCVEAASGKPGVTNPAVVCQWLYAKGFERGAAGPMPFSKSKEVTMKVEKVLTLLGLDEKATDEQVEAHIKKLQDESKKLQDEVARWNDICTILNLKQDAAMEEVVAAIKELVAKIEAPPAETKAQFAAMEGRIKTLETDLAAEKRTNRLAHYKEIVSGLKTLSGKPEVIAEELVALEEKSPEAAAKLITVYKETNERLIAAGLFTAKGSSLLGEGDDTHEFSKEVAKLVKEKHLSEADAFNEVKKTNPDLFREYMKQRPKVKARA